MPNITIVVPEDTAQMRVDKFLAGQEEILAACGCANRSHLQNIITNLTINGGSSKNTKPNFTVTHNDTTDLRCRFFYLNKVREGKIHLANLR